MKSGFQVQPGGRSEASDSRAPARPAAPEDPIPVKSERGRAELRARRGALRPRLRSLLVLADGHRSLTALRGMAAQIGASLDDLDELLREGFLELPVPANPTVPAPSEAGAPPQADAEPETPPPPSPPRSPPPTAPPPPRSTPISERHQALPAAAPADMAEPAPASAQTRPHPRPSRQTTVASPPPAARVEPAAPAAQAPPAPAAAQAAAPAATPLPAPTLQPGAPEADDVLHAARELLAQWFATDGRQLRMRELRHRIDKAADADQLAALVEELDARAPMKKRTHQGQVVMEQLRELLGLGNTRVAEELLAAVWRDTRTDWAATRPGT